MNWLSLKMKPTRTADAKHAPGKDYSKRKDNIDTCLICGAEVPPGPDFCGGTCENLYELAHRKHAAPPLVIE
jgi:hypothetical protein